MNRQRRLEGILNAQWNSGTSSACRARRQGCRVGAISWTYVRCAGRRGVRAVERGPRVGPIDRCFRLLISPCAVSLCSHSNFTIYLLPQTLLVASNKLFKSRRLDVQQCERFPEFYICYWLKPAEGHVAFSEYNFVNCVACNTSPSNHTMLIQNVFLKEKPTAQFYVDIKIMSIILNHSLF